MTEYNKGLNKCLQEDKIKIKTIIKDIINGGYGTNNHRIKPNIIEQIEARKKILDIVDDEISKEQIEILCDDKKFQAFINKKYLDLNEDDLNKTKIKLSNNDLALLAKDNKIINKINSLIVIEKLFKINRYQISSIDKNINLDNVKIELLKMIDKIIILFDGMESKVKLTKRITAKINNIKYYDQLQKFMADCYNSFGEIIKYKIKRESNRMLYIF